MKQWLFAYGTAMFVLAVFVLVHGIVTNAQWVAVLGGVSVLIAAMNLVDVYREVCL